VHAVAEHRSPQSAERLPAAVRRQIASLLAVFREFSHRLAVRVLGLRPEQASVPPPPQVLCRLDDVADGGVVGVDPPCAPGVPLILRRQGDSVQAWLNICPQDGRRMNRAPGLFHVDDGLLRCSVRGAVFALDRGGLCISRPCRGRSLFAVPVQVQGELVTIR